jgi:DNA-binding GntR family transcriptional regulator
VRHNGRVRVPVTHRSKKDYVIASLRRDILDGALAPGARLIIDELAASYGVSPIPVREALQQLQSDGYVVIQPYAGAKVAEIEIDAIGEIFALLESLEVISGRAACERMADADLDELERLVTRMDDMVDDPDRWSQENLLLHEFICTRAGTHLVEALLRKAMEQWDRLRRYYFKDVFEHRIHASQPEHRAIVRALRSRDADLVERIIREHNQTALSAYVGHLSRGQRPTPGAGGVSATIDPA